MKVEYAKEKNEVLSLLKEYLNKNSFDCNINLSKDFIKSILINNNEFRSILSSIKEKTLSKQNKNKNVLSNISNNDSKLIFLYLDKFSLLYDEPSFIIDLNKRIFNNAIGIINNTISNKIKLISPLNGNKDNTNSSIAFNNDLAKEAPLSDIDDLDDQQPSSQKINIYYIEDSKNLVSPKTILNELYNTKSNNISLITKTQFNSSFAFKFKIFDLDWYLKLFNQIISCLVNATEDSINNKKRRDTITELINENNKLSLKEVLIKGIPPSLRKDVYSFFLGKITLPLDANEGLDNNSKYLSYQNDTYLLTEYIINEELKNLSDTENYFLHMDIIVLIIKQLFRDTSLLTKNQSVKPLLYLSLNSTSEKRSLVYPPSGVIPLYGICYQCAPFSYLSSDVNMIYSIYSEYYCKYLSKISSFSSDNNSLISLLINFENLFSLLFTDIKQHFASLYYDINTEVCKWFLNSFTEVLSVQDVFILYDIILLTDSNHIFVLCALGIINYKKKHILTLSTAKDILNSLYFIKFEEIRIVELIKEILN